MFVSTEKYNRLAAKYTAVLDAYSDLVKNWNALVGRVNAKGGESFLSSTPDKHVPSNQFSKDDLTRLILLCHPDKHDGSQVANDVTVKLIAMRKQL